MSALAAQVERHVDRLADELVALSRRLHAHPEIGFEEHRAAGWLTELLSSRGFAVEPVEGLPTAFVATRGHGPFSVGLCAEYDALPGLGHACGHNIIAAASVGAALALAELADEAGLTVRLLGTPAEENGNGKQLMLARGCFDGLALAMMVHPGALDVVGTTTLACHDVAVDVHWVAAHASSSPHLGRNAADALTVAQVAVGLLRQHLPPGVQVHGITTRGGEAANIVPELASASLMIRALDVDTLHAAEKRLRACFEAGALATGTRMQWQELAPPYVDLRQDPDLTRHYVAALGQRGRQPADLRDHGQDPAVPRGSTDMGNVSHVVPSLHPSIGLGCLPALPHTADFAAAAASPSGDLAVVDGAALLALTTLSVLDDVPLRSRLLEAATSRRTIG